LFADTLFETDPNFVAGLDSIDASNARVEYLDSEIAEVKAHLSIEDVRLVNWSDVYEVELDGKIYYHIQDIGDGDFIGIDGEGNLFEIRHDPYEIKSRSGSLRTILSDFETTC
jgi:hypothetical protein